MTIIMTMVMREIKASEFKAKCLALMDEVNESGEAILVTKNGRPVAELHPHRQGRRSTPFGLHPAVDYPSDLIDIDFADHWDAMPEAPVL